MPSRCEPAVHVSTPVFQFCQVEVPWALGPPDGRYLVRASGAAPEEPPVHVLAFTTLAAPVPSRRLRTRRRRDAPPEPPPATLSSSRATVIAVGSPLEGAAQARGWLAGAGESDLLEALAVINRALHAFRLASADPYVHPVERRQLLVARIGYGAGEDVAEGRWSEARELIAPRARTRRARVLEPQAQLAALLAGRRATLACEELALRARLDLGQGREREAALQLSIALDAALAELADAGAIGERLAELRSTRQAVVDAASSALEGRLTGPQHGVVEHALERLEAALRARAAGLRNN